MYIQRYNFMELFILIAMIIYRHLYFMLCRFELKHTQTQTYYYATYASLIVLRLLPLFHFAMGKFPRVLLKRLEGA